MGEPALPLERMDAARAVIAQWRAAPELVLDCPVCGARGVALTDHSARPHTEWYRLACAACGLDHMLSLPMGAPVPGGEG